MASINDLPLLALERIFLYASGTNLLNWIHVYPRVCCLWREIMPHLWSKARILRIHSYNSQNLLSVFISSETKPLNLMVKDERASIATTFDYITSRCRKLAKLTLNLDSAKGLSMLKEPAQLENLCANFLKHSDSSQFMECVENLVNLQEIEIRNLSREEDLKLLANSVLYLPKNVRLVSFGIPRRLASVELLHFLSELHELETLKLEVECDYVSELIDVFAMCSDKLRNVSLICAVDLALNIEQCQNAMLQLAKKQIHSLHLKLWSGRWSPLGLEKIFCCVAEFNNLKELKLCCADFSNDEYAMVLQRLRLMKLRIELPKNLNDKFFNSFPVGMQMLEHFSISKVLSGSLPSLQSLSEFLVKCQHLEKFYVCIDYLKGPLVNFFRLFHAKFHVCGENSLNVNKDSALDITVVDYDDNIMRLTRYVKNENLCSFKILKYVNHSLIVLRFFKHCQPN